MTFDEIKRLDGWTVVLFYSTACAPCERLKPILREVCRESAVRLVEVNVASEVDHALALGIRTAPTVVVVKDGQAIVALKGFLNREPLVATLRMKGVPL